MTTIPEMRVKIGKLPVNLDRMDGFVNGPATGPASEVSVDDGVKVKTIARLALEAASDAGTRANVDGSNISPYSAEWQEAIGVTLPPLTPDTMIVTDPSGALREAKTFAEVVDLLGGVRNLRHYGATTVSDGSSAIATMAAAKGFVRFPTGKTIVGTNITIDVPMFFDTDAFIEVAAGVTLNLTNTVNAPNQWIFRGDGNVRVPLPDADSGEDVRELKAIWFGAFTQVPLDQAPAIQRAIDALGNSREGVVLFDCGSYDIHSGMTVWRGVKLKGVGTRRTVFQVKNDGYPVFQTGHTACFFEDIQCENSPVSLTREYPFIHLKHDFCEVTNFFHQSAKNAIIMDGTNCKVRNVEGVYGGADPGPGSSQVLIRAAGCSAEGLYARYSSGMGPTAIVEIGTGAAGSVTAFYVRNVEYVWGSIGVLIHGDNVSVARGMIRDVNYRGSPGNQAAAQVVKIKTSGAGNVFGVSINGLIISNQAVEGVTFEQGSTGSISRILIDDVYDAATTGSCIHFAQTAGTIRDIFIGANVRTDRANDITESIGTVGGVVGVRVAISGRRKGKTASFTVPYSGIEDGVTYHVQSSAAVTATLPNNPDGATVMSFKVTSSNGLTLSAQSGGTINNAGSLSVPAGRLIEAAMTRNVSGTGAQWTASQ